MSEVTAVVDEAVDGADRTVETTVDDGVVTNVTETQASLFPDEIKEEEEVREVLIPMQPHEVLECVDRIVVLNQEVNEQEQELEREKSRHKEAKDKITANIDAARPKLSKLIELTGLKKRRETTKTRKVINYTTKTVQWFVEGVDGPVDERPMIASEFQVKLALTTPAEGEEPAESEPEASSPNADAEMDHKQPGDAQGVDPSTFDEPVDAEQEGA